jgi:Glycosyl hydrolases family 25
VLAVDISNYTDPLTPTAVEGLKGAGVGHVIVQAIDPPPSYPVGRTRQQIQLCQSAGLTVDAYVWLWFDLDIRDIQYKLSLLDGLPIRQLWLDVEDTASIKYDQATCEAKVTAALAACDSFETSSRQKTGVYTGKWFWADQRYMGNSAIYGDRELWDANYDEMADAAAGFRPYGGWSAPRIKQYRGTSALAGIGGLDLNVLSVSEEQELVAASAPDSAPVTADAASQPTDAAAQPTDPAAQPSDPAAQPATETARETPDDWPWPTWYEAAINYKAIADQLGEQVNPARAAT